MGFKTITIKEEVYKKILKFKKKGESFSELFERTFMKEDDIMQFAGAWADLSEEEHEEMEKARKEYSEGLDRSTKERLKRLYGDDFDYS